MGISILKLGCIAVKYPKAKIVLSKSKSRENNPDKIYHVPEYKGMYGTYT